MHSEEKGGMFEHARQQDARATSECMHTQLSQKNARKP
jgi:hypothetical protein